MKTTTPTTAYPETRADICAALRALEVPDVDPTAPLYKLQYQLATASYAKAIACTPIPTATPTPISCKFESNICRAYAVMDSAANVDEYAVMDSAGTANDDVRWALYNCKMYSSDKESAAYIAATGLGSIYRAMKRSDYCAMYGSNLLCELFSQGVLSQADCISSVRAVLDSMIAYNNGTKGAYWVVNAEGVRFLHAVVTSSAANAELVSANADVASIIVAAKRILTGNSDRIRQCNDMLKAL
jgi:hypothetical protein